MSFEPASRALFDAFGVQPEALSVAPGRVNLIGEHTDYTGGFVFPAAIDATITVAAALTDGPTRLVSTTAGEGRPFDASSAEPGSVEGWARYPAGSAWALRGEIGSGLPNVVAAVHTDLPTASGLSSSAAIELAFLVLWNLLAEAGIDNKRLAQLGQKAENQFVGVNCGIMDQMASAMGRLDHAMFLDTLSLDIRYAPVPEQWAIVVCDTKTPRGLAGSKYNERRAEAEEARAAMDVSALRFATLDQLDAAKAQMSEVAFRRARHILTENERCQAMVAALERLDGPAVGEHMKASHLSLRDDFEVSCAELDTMAEAAWRAPGCVGARMTGAGFGGACVALVEQPSVAEFIEFTRSAYREHAKREPAFLSCRASEGARAQRV